MAATAGAELRYAGRAERLAFAQELARHAGVDPAVLAFALLGDPRIGGDSGANRNALLLDAAGESLFFADDDVRARAQRAPGAAEGLAFVSADPNEAWFPPASELIAEGALWHPVDPFALHESLLGADVARVAIPSHDPVDARSADVARVAMPSHDPVDLRGAGAAFFRRLARRGGRVVTTQLGGAGDHGMGGSFGLLLLGGPSRARLLASEQRFREAFESRRIVRCAPRASIGDNGVCMAMSLAVDARELVPPFAPAGRDADGLFGAVLRACVPDSFSGFLPWAIEHTPPGTRTASLDEEQAAAGRSGANELLRVALAALFDPRDTSTTSALARAGRELAYLAARPREADRFFREQTMRALARRLAHMERALADHARAPAFWAQAMAGFAASLRVAIASPWIHIPADLCKAHGPEPGRALFLAHVARVGALFEAWPSLFESARTLRSQGVRLSVPVAT